MINRRFFDVSVSSDVTGSLCTWEEAQGGLCISYCSKEYLEEHKDDDAFSDSCVYILVNETKSRELPEVYIGQADIFLERIRAHLRKSVCEQIYIIAKKPHGLDATPRNIVEHLLIKKSKEVGRCASLNKVTPKLPSVSPRQYQLAEQFVFDLIPVLELLGVPFFTEAQIDSDNNGQNPLPVLPDPPTYGIASIEFKIKSSDKAAPANTYAAKGYSLGDKRFCVRESSKVALDLKDYMYDSKYQSTRKTREKLLEKGILKKISGEIFFTEDHIFSTPSAAAMICKGGSSNGYVDWKDKFGNSLRQHMEGKLNKNKGKKKKITPIKPLNPTQHTLLYFAKEENKEIGYQFSATGYITNSGFVIQKGSTASKFLYNPAKTPQSDKRIRRQLLEEGILKEEPNRLRFASDYTCNTASGAARLCSGQIAENGKKEWKDANGVSLRDL